MGRFYFGLLLIILLPISAVAQTAADASPNRGWDRFDDSQAPPAPQKREWWEHALLWVPNRIMDAIDIFRVDAGVGAAYGGVARVSTYAEAGYRQMTPFSARVGLFGRKFPAMVETSNEFGISPSYVPSKDRQVCNGEVGVGADLIVGGYVGFCTEEVLDFIGGIFFLDFMNDDYK